MTRTRDIPTMWVTGAKAIKKAARCPERSTGGENVSPDLDAMAVPTGKTALLGDESL